MNKHVLLVFSVTVALVWCLPVDEDRQKRYSWYCLSLVHTHCFLQPKDPQCGSNNFTYYNKCEFSKDHCKNDRIHLLHNGTCNDSSHMANHTHGADVVFEMMCKTLTSCPDDFDEVCASDGRTYMNECEYEMKRCMHPEMHIVAKGPCSQPIAVSPF